jgi:hypothetical protein
VCSGIGLANRTLLTSGLFGKEYLSLWAAANRRWVLWTIYYAHGRWNGEELRREGAGNLIENLLQALG